MPLEGYTETSRKTIEKNDMNTAGVMQPLAAFNTVVDTDVGLIRLIAMHYRDPDVFDLNYLNKDISLQRVMQDLYNREQKNPLTICSKLSISELDELYNDFMENKYKEIVDLSIFTDLIRVMNTWQKYGGISTTILCNSEIEIDFLCRFSFSKNFNTELDNPKNFYNSYPQYIFKSFDDVYINSVFVNLVYNSTIYLAGYRFNITPLPEGEKMTEKQKEILGSQNYIKMMTGRNIIRYMDIYDRSKLYGGDKE